ncbi:MAG TPA: tyrosine-type recombinase/integrase [Longimicrobiales bacterium]|nr:tyrosine-type recombinase/integrase [Longimicrobiales bacterium]
MARKAKKQTRGRPRGRRTEGAHIYWRNGRAYGDFREYAKEGGRREALAEPGSSWGTTDSEIAQAIFNTRLEELKAKRRGRAGAPQQQSTTLAELVSRHLVMKAEAGLTSESHLADLEARLRAAIKFFGASRDPSTIVPADVRAWSQELARDGKRKPGTVRHYLNALSGLYRRAQEGLHVNPGYNPVAALQEKPMGRWGGDARFFEVPDAALLLEAARVLDRQEGGAPGSAGNRAAAIDGLYPIIATFLLTGGRYSEVLGLDVEDVSFDRGLVRFRPNVHRRLKTKTSERVVPLWPQLREILQAWMFDRDTPLTSGLLFPGPGGAMVGDLRKSLDAMGRLCGMEAGEVRTRAFRHTYCSARLQTVQRILLPGRDPADEKAWEYVEVSKWTVQKEMGHGGAQLVDRIYGHAQRLPVRSEVVEFRVENHRDVLGERLTALEAAWAR